MNGLTRVALLIGIAWLLWLAFQPRVAFVIRILKGESHLDRGRRPQVSDGLVPNRARAAVRDT